MSWRILNGTTDEKRCIRRACGKKFGMRVDLPECDDSGHALGDDGGGLRGRRQGGRPEEAMRDERKGPSGDRTLT